MRYVIFFSVIFLIFLKFFFISWQFQDQGFLVAPGGDQYNHIQYAEQLSQIAPYYPYPPLFHYLLLGASQFFQGDFLETLKAMAPYLLIIPVVMVFFLARSFFNSRVGLWALILTVFASGYPLFNFSDGSYPDLINYGLIIPLALIFLLRSLRDGRWRDIFISAILISLSFLTHQVSSILISSVLLVFLIVLWLGRKALLDKDQQINLNRLLLIYGLFLIIWLIILKFTFGPTFWLALKNLFAQGIGPVASSYASKPFEYHEINVIIRPLIEYLGLAGMALFLVKFNQGKDKQREKLLLLVWIGITWGLSRTEWSGLPPRFLRELELPLIICAAYLIDHIFGLTKQKIPKLLAGGLLGYLIVINTVQLFVPPFMLPDGFYPWVWYRKVDEQKYQYFLQNIPAGSIIFTNPSNPYLNYKLSKKYALKILGPAEVPDCQETIKIEDKKKFEEKCRQLRQDTINILIAESKAQYIFVGQKPYDIDEETFAEYTGFSQSTELINLSNQQTEIKKFNDGSIIYKKDK